MHICVPRAVRRCPATNHGHGQSPILGVRLIGEGMEAVDSRTMHVLIRDKDAPNWQDHTWKVAKVRPDGNRVVVTYTNGKQYPYGEDRVRLYDQVERRKVDALDEIRVCGQRWNSVESIWTLRCAEQPRNPRYTLAYRKADGTLALRRYASDEVRVRLATP